MSEGKKNPFVSPTPSNREMDATPDPPGDGPFDFGEDWIGGLTPLSLPGECLVCGKYAADNQRRARRYRHGNRSRYPKGCKISYSVCNGCGWWIAFWRRCMWFTLAIFGLSVIFAGVAFARLLYVDPFDPQRLAYIHFMLGSMLAVAVAFFVAAMSFSFQPLRIQRISDQGNRTSIFLPNQEFRRIVYERSVAQRMRDESEIE